MTKAKKNAAALATTAPTDLAALDELLGEEVTTGLEEHDASDVIVPSRFINGKLKGSDGRPLPIDYWVDSVTEEAKPEIRAALLVAKKTRSFKRFNVGEDRNELICRSFNPDVRTAVGVTVEGEVRPCAGCPDNVWRKDGDGRNVKNCAEEVRLLGIDLDEEAPFVITCRKTGLAPAKRYLSANYLNRRKLPNGKRTHLPLFLDEVTISAEVDASGKYARPAFTKGERRTREAILSSVADVEALSGKLTRSVEAADAVEAPAAASVPKTGVEDAELEDFSDEDPSGLF